MIIFSLRMSIEHTMCQTTTQYNNRIEGSELEMTRWSLLTVHKMTKLVPERRIKSVTLSPFPTIDSRKWKSGGHL